MDKNLIVLQEDAKNCGACCLLSIIRYHHGSIPLSKLEELTKTSKEGTNFYNIKKASEELGMTTKAFELENINTLDSLNGPILCQVIRDSYTHFIVIYEIKENEITIMDPSYGKVILSKEALSKIWTGNVMIFDVYKKLPFIITNNHIKKSVMYLLIQNSNIIVNIILLSVLFTAFTGLSSFYFKIILDKIITTDINNLNIVTIIFIFVSLIKITSSLCRNYLIAMVSSKIDMTLTMNIYEKILSLPYNYFKTKQTGEIITRIQDLANIKDFTSELIITSVLDVLLLVISGIILCILNTKLFYITLLISLVHVIITICYKNILKLNINKNKELASKANSYLIETIEGYETIKGQNIEENCKENFEFKYGKVINNIFHINNIVNSENYLKELTEDIGSLIITFIGIKMVMENNTTLGTYLTYSALLAYFLGSMKNIINLNIKYYYAKTSLNRANDFYEIEGEDQKKETNLDITGNIVLKNFEFSYNEKDIILTNINFEIKDKEKVLLLGPSGVGKSTILKTIHKYYEPKRNQIAINKIDINDYSVKDIRKNICYLSQNEIIFAGSIKENIMLNETDEKRFQDICKIVELDKIITKKNIGYDMKLEENGFNISGGEKQRIFLARSLYKESKILLIDEGLNELDIDSERRILKNIFKAYKEKTVLIVSHRIENTDLFDKKIVISREKAETLERSKT